MKMNKNNGYTVKCLNLSSLIVIMIFSIILLPYHGFFREPTFQGIGFSILKLFILALIIIFESRQILRYVIIFKSDHLTFDSNLFFFSTHPCKL